MLKRDELCNRDLAPEVREVVARGDQLGVAERGVVEVDPRGGFDRTFGERHGHFLAQVEAAVGVGVVVALDLVEGFEHGVWIGGSCPEIALDAPAHDQRPSNAFVLAGPDGTVQRYRKIHPFSHADEERYVRAGSTFTTVEIDGVRLSLFVCYDLRFADEFWALAHDTDAYLVVANWPEKRRLHWSTLLRARAIENQAYVVGVNRVGEGGGLTYSGDSAIIDPLGEILASGAGAETVLFADIDTEHVAGTRSHFRFLQDRR